MVNRVFFFLLLLGVCTGAVCRGEEPRSLTDEDKEFICMEFRVMEYLGNEPLYKRIGDWAAAANIPHEVITDYVLELIDDIYYKKVYGDELSEPQQMDAGGCISLLMVFHPGPEETDRLLRDLIEKDCFGTRTRALRVYICLHQDGLWQDDYIRAVMTGEVSLSSSERAIIFGELKKAYAVEPPEIQEEMLKLFQSWANNACGIRMYCLFDDFFLDHIPGYIDSDGRRENLMGYLAYYESIKITPDSRYYKTLKQILDDFPGDRRAWKWYE